MLNQQSHDCLLNRLSRRRSYKTSKLHVTSLYEGNLPVTVEFPTQKANDAGNESIWWRHHGQHYMSPVKCLYTTFAFNLTNKFILYWRAWLTILLILYESQIINSNIIVIKHGGMINGMALNMCPIAAGSGYKNDPAIIITITNHNNPSQLAELTHS